MKKDCGKTEMFLSEWKRMCESAERCSACPGSDNFYPICDTSIRNCSKENINSFIEIVQKWSDEHPEQSIKEKFLEVFPNAPTKFDGYPYGCCVDLGLKTGDCSGINCKDCWNRPYQEVEEC